MRRVLAIALVAFAACAGPAGAAIHVTWMRGFAAPATPLRYDRVGVIRIGSPAAKNVLVFEPGTSAGGSYIIPFAQWLSSRLPGWQVWSIERRQNLLEDQSVLNLAKVGKASPRKVFDYYLGYLVNPRVKRHMHLIPDARVQFAKGWGLNVAMQDLRRVIAAAHKLGGKVVLAGHSLGGALVTAYATWDFGGHAGADQLAGLVYDDGGTRPAVSAAAAQAMLAQLDQGSSPWLSFGGIPAPFAGVFSSTGALSALLAPNAPSLGQTFSGLPPALKPPVRVTNVAQYGYSLNVGTSPPSLIAAQAHLGRGVSSRAFNGVHGWDGTGALTPIRRFAAMFAGAGMLSVDGTEWYFPQRLTDDCSAIGNGIANPAQRVLGVHATMGRRLPKTLLIYAFGAALGGRGVLLDAEALAAQSGIPKRNLVLIDRHRTYAHNDPAGAFPKNAFFRGLVAFLKRVSAE